MPREATAAPEPAAPTVATLSHVVVRSEVATHDVRLDSARTLARAERDRAFAQAAIDEARGLRAARLCLSSDRERERVRAALLRRCALIPGCEAGDARSLDEVRTCLWRR